MQTSLARRQARRMNGSRRRRGGGVGRKAAVALPLFLFASLALVGLVGAIGVVGVFAAYSQDLTDPRELERLEFVQESVVYDRTGRVELARFSAGERREWVDFEDIPPVLIDATTGIEDRNFWTHTGFDPVGIMSAALDTLRGDERGASTITQQLARQRLLDEQLVRDPNRLVERKIKEIIQSIRVSETYPGDEGKQRVITAYLNQNYYGNNSYGVMAAAKSYFGHERLDQLTLGQAAILAALPQSPSTYDLVRNAQVDPATGRLHVPLDPENIAIVARRNYVLDLLANDPTRRVLTGDTYTREQFLAAKDEPINLAPQQRAQQWLAPHFVWAVRRDLSERLCGDAETCPVLERGGLRIITSLDMRLQAAAEKWVTAGVFLPHADDPEAFAEELGVPYEQWMRRLGRMEVSNGALIALDYETGEIVAYVGSAGYYRNDLASPKFQPQFDVLGDGWRQPGSAYKPFNYVVGINDRRMTAATMFMDVTTRFPGGPNGYIPKNYDLLERGPMRMRSHLQWSLNIGPVKALEINGINHVFDMARRFGMSFQTERPRAGLSLTLGTEVSRPRDVAVAYGTLANGGRYVGHTHIVQVIDRSGDEVIAPREAPVGEPVVTPQAAYIMTHMLASNTRPAQNPIWGAFAVRNSEGERRDATIKTGTSQDANDLVAYGYIAPPDAAGREAGQYALVVGAWNGNSDGSPVTAVDVVHSINRVIQDPQSRQKAAVAAPVVRAEAVDKHTVAVTTETPTAVLPDFFCDRLIVTSKATYDKYGRDAADRHHMMGAGPYRLKELVPGQRLVIEKRPDHPEAKKNPQAPDEIVFRVMREVEQRVTALLNNEIQIAQFIPPHLRHRIEGSPNHSIRAVDAVEIMFLAMQPKPPFDKKEVRQAVCYAIDRDRIINTLLEGFASRLDGPIGAGQYGYDPKLKPRYEYNPEKARKLLAQAGYPNGVDVELQTPVGRYTLDKQITEAIVPMLTGAGIRTRLLTPEWPTLWANVQRGTVPFYYMGRGSVIDPSAALHQYFKTGGSPRIGYSNPKLDDLFDRELGEFDPDRRRRYLSQAMSILTEEAPACFMWRHQLLWGLARNVDYAPLPDGRIYGLQMKLSK
jgi:peptide/nickel transport system substrate-binding protein